MLLKQSKFTVFSRMLSVTNGKGRKMYNSVEPFQQPQLNKYVTISPYFKDVFTYIVILCSKKPGTCQNEFH